jgi:outer membrane protein, heavy metal efflux system
LILAVHLNMFETRRLALYLWKKVRISLKYAGMFAALAALPVVAAGQSQSVPTQIDLAQAVQLAMAHNHALKAARTLIAQSKADEISAAIRPNPVLTYDDLFIPLTPSQWNTDTFNNVTEFDLGVSYTIERGKKRQRRMDAAKDVTAMTQSQVADSERALTFNVAQQFLAVLLAKSDLEFAQQDLKSFQQTVDISQSRLKAGDISEGDFLKIKLQLLQFQTDVSSAQLALVQSKASLRALIGYDALAENYDVVGELNYAPLRLNREDLQSMALGLRPDLLAAKQGVTSANSQYALARANGKRDLTTSLTYSHVAAINGLGFLMSIELPFFDRNQGEIARTHSAITQSQETRTATEETVMTDVATAYEAAHTGDQIVQLYQSGYLKQAQESRDISEYAYKRGAASLLDFLDAERSYRSTQLAYRQALAQEMLALEQLREAVGTRKLP